MASMFAFLWLTLTLLWLASFIVPMRRQIARTILAPLQLPLHVARWMTAAGAIGCLILFAALSQQPIAAERIMSDQFVAILAGILTMVVLTFFVLRFYREVSDLRRRYSSIIDVDAELTPGERKAGAGKTGTARVRLGKRETTSHTH